MLNDHLDHGKEEQLKRVRAENSRLRAENARLRAVLGPRKYESAGRHAQVVREMTAGTSEGPRRRSLGKGSKR